MNAHDLRYFNFVNYIFFNLSNWKQESKCETEERWTSHYRSYEKDYYAVKSERRNSQKFR